MLVDMVCCDARKPENLRLEKKGSSRGHGVVLHVAEPFEAAAGCDGFAKQEILKSD